MKRSEMLQLIQSSLSSNVEGYYSNTASDVLEAIEKAGMLPPPKELANVTATIKYYYSFEEVDEDVDYHTNPSLFWEKE